MADIASFLGKSGALISIAASDISEGLRHVTESGVLPSGPWRQG